MVSLSTEVEAMVDFRNEKIEEAIRDIEDSYNYARHIQTAFLPEDLYVRECFPDNFILYKPKDIVSGDFYFFSKRTNHIIFAAADCTGHGIPGALLSTLGYGILDQAVNQLLIEDPQAILQHLYSRIHRFLRRDEAGVGISDDMDIVLCSFDIRSNHLTYAGVNNPLYLVREKKLIEFRANNIIGDRDDHVECLFTSDIVVLNHGDTIYLCSDGYIDQFGGKNHKRYLSRRFKPLLLEIQDLTLPEQSDKLFEEIESWREENREDQTDDILIIGIRI